MVGTCPHCASIHPAASARCPSTGLPMGGDPGLVGTTIARRFVVVRLLGDGGMGAVYKAADQVLGRFVAIKLLHAGALEADPEAIARFQLEARSAASIGHPNIIEVIDFGDSDGPFMVMEYLRGRSLAQLLDGERRLDVERACRIAGHTLAGLEAAHALGVVHRDLKPANLMLVCHLGDRDFVKVCDFGLAAFVAQARLSERALTPRSTVVGTPAYIAPERFQQPDQRDPRVDLYAVGVMLYEMLAGRRPFEGPTLASVVRAASREPPPRLRELRPEVPGALEAVIEMALAKTPDERWQHAGELADALVPFGGTRVTPGLDPPSDAFDLDLFRIRARESQLQVATTLTMPRGAAPAASPSRPPADGSGVVPRPERAFDGEVAAALLRFLRARFGAEAVARMLGTLVAGDRDALASGEPWIPYEAVRHLMEQTDRVLGDDDLHFVVECGRAIADGIYARHAHLESPATPERCLDALPAVGALLVRGVGYSVRRTGQGHGRLELVEHTESPSLTGCVATLGFVERSLVRAGGRDVEVNLVSCRGLGDDRCLFDATWLVG